MRAAAREFDAGGRAFVCGAAIVQPLDTFARGVYLTRIKPPRGGGVDFLYENTFRHTFAGNAGRAAFFYARRMKKGSI